MKASGPAPRSRSFALAGLAAAVLAFSGQAAVSQTPVTAKSLEGVWKVTKVVMPGPNGSIDTHPQPSLQIFYQGYFSLVRDNGAAPRQPSPPVTDPSKLTDEEKLARYAEWAPFSAAAGTYEVEGDTLITHNIVAKQAGGVGLTEEATIVFTGDTFVATAKATGGAPNAGRQTTYTCVR